MRECATLDRQRPQRRRPVASPARAAKPTPPKAPAIKPTPRWLCPPTTRHAIVALKRALGLPEVALPVEIASERSVGITLEELEISRTRPAIRQAILARTRAETPGIFKAWEAAQYEGM